jgi:hypothetical protein
MKNIREIIKEELNILYKENSEFAPTAVMSAPSPEAPQQAAPAIEPEPGNNLINKKIVIYGNDGSAFQGKVLKAQDMRNYMEITFMTPWKRPEKIQIPYDEFEELASMGKVNGTAGNISVA